VLGITTKLYPLHQRWCLRVGAGSDLPAVNTRAEYQLLGLAGGGVCPASAVTGTAVRSYRAISPLPVSAFGGPSAVYFLWHFPCPAPIVNHLCCLKFSCWIFCKPARGIRHRT